MKLGKKLAVQAAAVVIVLFVGLAVMLLLQARHPKMVRAGHKAKAPAVRAMRVKKIDYPVRIKGYGTVEPATRITLAAQVSGKVVEIDPALVPGGSFKAGRLLARIDPADYKIAVVLAKARLADARSKLQLLEAEAREARQEWRQLHPDTPVPSLAAKQPQLEAARAEVEARSGELEKARLELARTMIRAPFDGLVESRQVGLGQYVGAGKGLATLIGTAAAEIPVPLESSRLHWFHVPGFTPGGGRGAKAQVMVEVAGARHRWQGRVVRAGARVDPRTRMVDVYVRVENPFNRRPPLAAGLFAEVTIFGRTISRAVVLPPEAVRQGGVVWVVGQDGRLRFRKVQVALTGPDGAVISSGLEDGQVVVLSDIKGVSREMAVRPVFKPTDGRGSR